MDKRKATSAPPHYHLFNKRVEDGLTVEAGGCVVSVDYSEMVCIVCGKTAEQLYEEGEG